MNGNEYMQATQMLYARAVEVQPQLALLVQDFKAMGMSDDEVAIELSFAMLHEGYRIRHMEETVQGMKLRPHERKLQTHVDIPENKHDTDTER